MDTAIDTEREIRSAPLRRAAVGLVAGSVLPVLAGCASSLQPAPGTAVTERGATETAASVTISVRSDAWDGRPGTFSEYQPLLVSIENRSDRPVTIRYDNFRLGTAGSGLAAVDPRRMDGTEFGTVSYGNYDSEYLDYFTYSGFRYAPEYAGSGVGDRGAHAGGSESFDEFGIHSHSNHRTYSHHPSGRAGFGLLGSGGRSYHSLYAYPQVRGYDLPTRDVLARAVPEGSLQPGGELTGYLYFPRPDDDAEAAEFTVTLEDAENGSVRRGAVRHDGGAGPRLRATAGPERTGRSAGRDLPCRLLEGAAGPGPLSFRGR